MDSRAQGSDDLRRYYDAKWSRARRLNVPGRLRRLQVLDFVRRHAPVPVGGPLRLVDLGCGQGTLAAALARFGEVVAVDFSEAAIEANRRAIGGVRFEVADLTDPELPDRLGRFDVVTCSEVVEHVEPASRERFFSNLAAVVRPGGLLVVTTPFLDDLDVLREEGEPREAFSARLDDQPVHAHLYRDELVAWLAGDFEVLESTSVHPIVRRRGLDLLWKAAFLPVGHRAVNWIAARLGLPRAYLVMACRRAGPA